MTNVLIIGGTGFLGRNLVKYITTINKCVNIHITGHSELRIALFRKMFPKILVHSLSIENIDECDALKNLIVKYNFDCIIHTAAMKHVGICQNNITKTLYTNVIFTEKLINLCNQFGITKMITISTDKANDPCNVYGMSKYMMQELTLENKFKVFQGVNFLWSDGSVLDIWFNQYKLNKELTYTKLDTCRYYNKVTEVCETIWNGLDNSDSIIITDKVYKIYLNVLLEAFCKYFKYYKTKQIEFNNYEKDVEQLINLPNKSVNIIELDIDQTVDFIADTFNNIICA